MFASQSQKHDVISAVTIDTYRYQTEFNAAFKLQFPKS